MKRLPLRIPKFFLIYRYYILFLALIYIATPIFILHYLGKYITYFSFAVAWYAPFFVALILLFYITDRETTKIRAPLRFIRQKHFTHHTKPKLALISGVEVGVDTGSHALQMLGYLNLKKLSLIDPWERYTDHGVDGFPGRDWNQVYESVKRRMSEHENVEIIREVSVKASKLIEDSTLDFVYIDANHEYEHVLEDLRAWYPKLKGDGVLCGDDFGAPSSVGLIRGVTEFAYEHQLLVFSEKEQFWMVKPTVT